MSNKHSESKNEIPQEMKVLNILIKEGYEKILTDYLKIEKTLNSLNKDIPIKIKDSFSNIINQIENMQKYFKNYINSINNSISSLLSNLNLENINLEINSSVKQSYSQICDEFCKIETITKEVISNKEKLKNQRKNRIKLLERRLQSYCDEINNFDFSKNKIIVLRLRTYAENNQFDVIENLINNSSLKILNLTLLNLTELYFDYKKYDKAVEYIKLITEPDYFEYKIDMLKYMNKYEDALFCIISDKKSERKELHFRLIYLVNYMIYFLHFLSFLHKLHLLF